MAEDEDDIDFLADVEDIKATPERLNQLNRYVAEAQALEAEAEAMQEQLKITMARLREITDGKLPEMMQASGVRNFTTTDGRKVSIEKKYTASISEGRADLAHQWLDEHGHAAIIKHVVSVQFDRSQHNEALSLVNELRERDLPVGDKQNVHPSTLRAFVREQLEHGNDLPRDLFGVFVVDRAVIK